MNRFSCYEKNIMIRVDVVLIPPYPWTRCTDTVVIALYLLAGLKDTINRGFDVQLEQRYHMHARIFDFWAIKFWITSSCRFATRGCTYDAAGSRK